MKITQILPFALLFSFINSCLSFVYQVSSKESFSFVKSFQKNALCPKQRGRRYTKITITHASDSDVTKDESPTKLETEKEMTPLTKASWYAVEAFGKIFGSSTESKQQVGEEQNVKIDFSKAPSSLDELFKRIELDNERSYFLSGEVDKESYDPNCVFADPFVSFKGRDRFIDNLANLGSFITKYDAKMLKYEVEDSEDEPTVQTKLMVKLELNLPWKPVLAWPWGVKYVIDKDTFLINQHIESWDIEPVEGVKQIFRKPTIKI